MNISIAKSKVLKYLIWPGLSLFLIGLSAGIVAGKWGTAPMILMILGLAIIAFWILLQVTAQGFWMKRSTQVGTNAFIATTAMMVILILLNVLVARYPQRLDLTENQIYSLAPQSKQIVQELAQPVRLYVFSPTKPPQVENLLKNYARLSTDRFSYQFVNPTQEPGLVQKFELKDVGDVFLEAGDKQRFVQNIGREPFSESKLTNALARLKRDRTDKVFFLQGHGEHSPEQLSQAINLLKDRNYEIEPLTLAQTLNNGEGIPADTSVIMVSGPQRALLEPEVKALSDFLNRGGGVLLLIDPNTDPKLSALLDPWGVKLDDRLIIDGSDTLGINGTGGVVGIGPTSPLVTRYGDHPITAEFGNGISFYPLSRAVELQERPGINAVPLLLTHEQSWAEKDVQAQVQYDPSRDLKGPLAIGAALSRPVAEASENRTEENPTESRLVVIGNASFITNGPVEQQLNPDVFANAIAWLSQREGEVLSISPRELTNRRIILGPVKGNAVAFSAVLLLPLLGFGTAAFLWWKRR